MSIKNRGIRKLESYYNTAINVPIIGDMLGSAIEKEVPGLESWKKLVNAYGVSGPRAYSGVADGGGTVVISNTQGKTLKLNNNSEQWESLDNPSKQALLEYLQGKAQKLI